MMEMNIKETHIKVPLRVTYLKIEPKIESEKKHLIILLHGYQQSALEFYHQLEDYLPENAHVLAINGIFPLPSKIKSSSSLRFAWYFFDSEHSKYLIEMDTPRKAIYDIYKKVCSDEAWNEISVIGYSQGGYLAPFAALEFEKIDKVIGINCQFKEEWLPLKYPFSLYGIHGELDLMVDPNKAINSFRKLVKDKNKFFMVPGEGHRLTANILNCLKKIFL